MSSPICFDNEISWMDIDDMTLKEESLSVHELPPEDKKMFHPTSDYETNTSSMDFANFQLFPEVDDLVKSISEEFGGFSALSNENIKPLLNDQALAANKSKRRKLDRDNECNEKENHSWTCDICFKKFRHQYTLSRHFPTHTNERKYKCEICGKAFRQMSTLSQHKAIHSNERPHSCNICEKTFNRISTLISHRKTHTGVKPHKCDLCGRAFHQKGNLRNHRYTHTNERPYKCDLCDKGFNQMSNLTCHRSHAHAEIGIYQCEHCCGVFSKRNILREHEEMAHGIRYTTRQFQRRGVMTSQNIISPGGQMFTSVENMINNGVIIEPINTLRMKETLRRGEMPFVSFEAQEGWSALLKVEQAAHGKQVLLAPSISELNVASRLCSSEGGQRIKIPVVATAYITTDNNGQHRCTVVPIGLASGISSRSKSLKNLGATLHRELMAKKADPVGHVVGIPTPKNLNNLDEMICEKTFIESCIKLR